MNQSCFCHKSDSISVIGAFDIPHSLALDESNGRLYIADRQNGRVQCLDTSTGVFDPPINKQEFGLVFAVDFNSHNGEVCSAGPLCNP